MTRSTAWWWPGALLAVVAIVDAPRAVAETRETAAVVTEIKVGRGRVDVRAASGQWRAATPLLALRAGDQVLTTENAVVVVVLTGGRGAVRIDAGRSPWTVPAAAEMGKAKKVEALVESGLSYLSGTPKETPDAVLVTRAGRAPRIVAPRGGEMLGEPVVFEWTNRGFAPSTVRVVAPAGVVFERVGVAAGRLIYPDDAPALVPGVRYTLHVSVRNHDLPPTTFEIVDAVRLAGARDALGELEATIGSAGSTASVAALKAAVLASLGLVYDARLVILAALAIDPREPTLHTILGRLYQRTGLPDDAARAFDEANLLLQRIDR